MLNNNTLFWKAAMSFRGYVSVLLTAFIGLSAVNQLYWRAERLSCWSGGYAQNAWLAYCNSDKYGVYDADAVWFGTEPDIATGIDKAQVLTLSDSRLQNALSIGGASEWFSNHHFRAYFLGLPTEESGFGELLWEKYKPHPRVVIFDASPYFTGGLGWSETSLIEDPQASKEQLADLKSFQDFHQSFCGKIPAVCGQNFAYFKSRDDGHWIFPDPDSRPLWGRRSVPNNRSVFPTESTPNEFLPLYPEYLKQAQNLISKIDLPRHCIVITHVPSEDALGSLAPYLSKSLGVTLIEPQVPSLATFDRAHLTPSSSRQWTRAFLQQLEPVLQSCIRATA
jgi:hypothetical protein